MKRTAFAAAMAATTLGLAACDNPSVPKPDMSRAAPASGTTAGTPAAPAAQTPASPVAALLPRATSPQQQLNADMALSSKVKEALQTPVREHVEVAATDGVITLYGTVEAPADKERVALTAMNVDGVRSVVNNLVVIRGS